MKKHVQGFPNYSVDKSGNVYNKYGKPLKPWKTKKGYYRVKLYTDEFHSKMFQVHRLIAMTFIPNSNNLSEVNHIDGNKLNNHVDNLEWCTPKENTAHAEKLGLRKNCYGNACKNRRKTNESIN